MFRSILLLAGSTLAFAQYSITTVAGGAPPATPWSAPNISIGQPNRVITDSAGNVYFTSGNCIFKMAGTTLTRVAGNSRAGYSGDGGPALNAQFNSPQGIAFDPAGNLYVADSINNRVRRIAPDGTIITVAGNGIISPGGGPAAFGDGGLAVNANLHLPMGVAFDKNTGNLYIADSGDHLLRVVNPDGIIHIAAGTSFPEFGGDYGTPTAAALHTPTDVAIDSSGNLFIADKGNAAIREITGGAIITFAGNASIGFSGDNGSANKAGLIGPVAVTTDSSGNVFFAEENDSRIRKVDKSGTITTVAGNGTGNFAGDGGSATAAQLNSPTGIAVDGSGNLFIADSANLRIRKVSGTTIGTVAGNGLNSFSGDDWPATSAQLDAPQGLAVDDSGNIYVADTANHVVRKVGTDGIISRFAGTGTAGFGGDNAAATSAQLDSPRGVAVDAAGSVYIADTLNARVRKVSGGVITTVAGSGTPGFGGDGGSPTSAMLNTPTGVAVDSNGNLYISDLNNQRIRKVSGGTITTAAGTGLQSFGGDGGNAIDAQLNLPQGVAVDRSGNLYIADTGNNRVRLVTPAGTITTIGGNGQVGHGGDGGRATSAQIGNPTGIAVDAAGSVYVSDGGASVRRILPGGVIATIAGNGSLGYAGDGGPATNARLNQPTALALDPSANLYIADTANDAVRMLQAPTSNVSVGAVVNGATNQRGAIAPGEVIVIYGSNLGPTSLVQTQLGSDGRFPSTLAGTSVAINGAPATMLYTSANQISAVVPYDLAGSTAQIVVTSQQLTSTPVRVAVAPVAPGIFTANSSGAGPAAAVNFSDSTLNGPDHPAKAGDYVLVYMTGAGQTSPASQGAVPAVDARVVAPISVTVGGKATSQAYAGTVPGYIAGLIQVNVLVPDGLAPGAQPVVIGAGSESSQSGVTIWVQ